MNFLSYVPADVLTVPCFFDHVRGFTEIYVGD